MMRDFEMPGRSAVYASNGICATSHPLAAGAAIDILKAGGNAMDAAIAGAVLLGICEPQMTGIGGDCFVLFKPAGTEKIHAMNGSGRAPMGLDADKLRARGLTAMPLYTADAVTLPGAVDAFCRLSADWGKIGLAATLAPAIHYADQGVPVAPRVASDWAAAAPLLQGRARETLLHNGKPLILGQIFRAPGQAQVLRRIAEQGRAGFYEGEVAQDMVTSLNALGGTHTLDDFAAVKADYVDPVSGPYSGVNLHEHPPNCQCATAILLLKILSHFNLSAMDPLGADRAHLEAEATKLAYDARNRFLADPDHTTRLAHMLADDTAAKLAALIDPARATPDPARLSESIHKDTIYITVVDKDRMAVSLIYSVYHSFGACLASDKFGINFQNRGAGFTLQADHPNEAAGGKRPMHTIIPGMISEGGRVTVPFGVMGGAYQPTGHARFLSNITDFGMDLQTAMDTPRCFSGIHGLEMEKGYADAVRANLVARGHKVVRPEVPLGGSQAIRIHGDGLLEGASDPRKDGCALGY
jgi:gamma-glutamyltranspeptidase/glutathione hydrolase